MALEVSPVGVEDAAVVTSRVQLVADKLLQKAQEAQARGNATAAQSLSESVADLRRAASLLEELHRRVARPPTPSPSPPPSSNGSSPSSQPPSRSTSVKDLLVKLGRVEVMLGKKSDEMRQKGNEAAAQALQQAAWTVRQGAQHVTEQQQLTRALVGTARGLREELHAMCELILGGENAGDSDAPRTAVAMERARELVALWETAKSSHPACTTASELQDAILAAAAAGTSHASDTKERVDALTVECERLQQLLDDAETQRHALESEWSQRWNAVNDELSAANASLSQREEEHEAAITALQMELEASRRQAESAAQSEQLKSIEAQLETERQAAAAKYDTLKQQQQELIQNVKRLETENEDLKSQMMHLREEHERLQEQRDRQETREHVDDSVADALQQEIQALNDKQEQLMQRIADADERHENALNELSTARQRANELESKCVAFETTLEDQQHQVKELQAEKCRLEEELVSTRDALAAASTSAEELESTSSAESKRVKTLLAPLQTDDFEWKQLHDSLSTSLSIQTASVAEQEAPDAVAAALKRVVERAMVDISRLQESSARERDALIARVLTIVPRDQGEDNCETLEALEVALQSIVHSKNTLAQERDSLLEKVKTLQQDLAAIESSNSAALRDANEAADAAVAALREELVSATERVASLTQQIESHQAERQASTASSERDVEQLRKQLADVQSEFERYRTRSHAALKKMEKRAELLNGMRKENEELKTQVEELRSRQDATAEQEQIWRNRIDELQSSLAMREEEIEQRELETTAQLMELASKHDVMASELKESVALVAQLRASNSELCSKMESFQNAAKEARAAALEQSQNAVQKLENELASTRSELSEANTQLEVSKATLQSMQETLEAKEVEWAARVAAAEETVATQDNDASASKDRELTALLSEKDGLVEENCRLNAEMKTQVASLERLSQQIKELESKLASATGEIQELRRQGEATIGTDAVSVDQEVQEREEEHQATIVKLQRELSVAHRRVEELSRLQISREDLAARDEVIKSLRKRLLELEEEHAESDNGEDDKALQHAQMERQQKLELKVLEATLTKRQAAVTAFQQRASSVVEELQHRLEEYSVVFRDACALQEETLMNGSAGDSEERQDIAADSSDKSDTAFEEYLVFKSGVVIKAGATFSLPVVCEREGLRVVWKFTVKEDGADVAFALSVSSNPRETIVPKERVNALSGVFNATASGTSLLFEWDNSFSWLNEKTLAYHVSVLEPLTAERRQQRDQVRQLDASVQQAKDALVLLGVERERRVQLQRVLERLVECEKDKETLLAQVTERRAALQQDKSELQTQMNTVQAQLSTIARELLDLDEQEQTVQAAWDSLASEREDVEMTIGLSKQDQRLQAMAERLDDRVQRLERERKLSSAT
ncbi:hypothetical protein PINS_up000576 [Pythium insidiosum]|nr:hypothetical protein PINS_up000576 [Pythium insidiosum]